MPPPDVDRLNANGAAVGAATDGCPKPAEPPNGAGETDGAGASAVFCPKLKPEPLDWPKLNPEEGFASCLFSVLAPPKMLGALDDAPKLNGVVADDALG